MTESAHENTEHLEAPRDPAPTAQTEELPEHTLDQVSGGVGWGNRNYDSPF